MTTLLQGCHCNLFIDSFLTVEPEDAPCKKACNTKDPVTTLLQGRHCNLFIDSFLTIEPEDAPCKKACNKKGPVTPLVRKLYMKRVQGRRCKRVGRTDLSS